MGIMTTPRLETSLEQMTNDTPERGPRTQVSLDESLPSTTQKQIIFQTALKEHLDEITDACQGPDLDPEIVWNMKELITQNMGKIIQLYDLRQDSTVPGQLEAH